MMTLDAAALWLLGITLFAATVNGALGYGFSSLTVPVAVLFYANRILNPALVLVEVVVNTHSLFINRKSVPRVWRRVMPILIGLVPGVIVGSLVLSSLNGSGLKLLTYAVLLPLILLQAAGIRRWRSCSTIRAWCARTSARASRWYVSPNRRLRQLLTRYWACTRSRQARCWC